MKQYQCSKCGEVDCLVSVETEIHNYNIFPNEHGEKEYDGYSKVVHGQIENILCTNCYEDFTEDQLEEMIVSTGGEE